MTQYFSDTINEKFQLDRNNYIINGSMDIWQRGTSGFTSGYTADRWVLDVSGAAGPTLSRWANTVFPDPFRTYSILTAISNQSASSDYVQVVQRIEDLSQFSNKTVTLSFDIYGGGGYNVAVRLTEVYGSGGSASVNTTAHKHSCPATWTKIKQTFTLSDMSAKTFGSSHCLSVNIIFSAGSNWDGVTDSLGIQNGNFYITNVKLEEGDAASPFIARQSQQELALCQRYYIRRDGIAAYYTIGFGFAPTGVAVRGFIPAPVSLRTAPTIYGIREYRGSSSGTITANNPNAILANNGILFSDAVTATIGEVVSVVMNLAADTPNYFALDAEL